MNLDTFMKSLVIMGKGMSGIFIVMLIIFLAIKGLNYLFKSEE